MFKFNGVVTWIGVSKSKPNRSIRFDPKFLRSSAYSVRTTKTKIKIGSVRFLKIIFRFGRNRPNSTKKIYILTLYLYYICFIWKFSMVPSWNWLFQMVSKKILTSEWDYSTITIMSFSIVHLLLRFVSQTLYYG